MFMGPPLRLAEMGLEPPSSGPLNKTKSAASRSVNSAETKRPPWRGGGARRFLPEDADASEAAAPQPKPAPKPSPKMKPPPKPTKKKQKREKCDDPVQEIVRSYRHIDQIKLVARFLNRSARIIQSWFRRVRRRRLLPYDTTSVSSSAPTPTFQPDHHSHQAPSMLQHPPPLPDPDHQGIPEAPSRVRAKFNQKSRTSAPLRCSRVERKPTATPTTRAGGRSVLGVGTVRPSPRPKSGYTVPPAPPPPQPHPATEPSLTSARTRRLPTKKQNPTSRLPEYQGALPTVLTAHLRHCRLSRVRATANRGVQESIATLALEWSRAPRSSLERGELSARCKPVCMQWWKSRDRMSVNRGNAVAVSTLALGWCRAPRATQDRGVVGAECRPLALEWKRAPRMLCLPSREAHFHCLHTWVRSRKTVHRKFEESRPIALHCAPIKPILFRVTRNCEGWYTADLCPVSLMLRIRKSANRGEQVVGTTQLLEWHRAPRTIQERGLIQTDAQPMALRWWKSRGWKEVHRGAKVAESTLELGWHRTPRARQERGVVVVACPPMVLAWRRAPRVECLRSQEANARRLLIWRRVTHTFHRQRVQGPVVSLSYTPPAPPAAAPVQPPGLWSPGSSSSSLFSDDSYDPMAKIRALRAAHPAPPAETANPQPPPSPPLDPTPEAALFRARRGCDGWHTFQLPSTYLKVRVRKVIWAEARTRSARSIQERGMVRAECHPVALGWWKVRRSVGRGALEARATLELGWHRAHARQERGAVAVACPPMVLAWRRAPRVECLRSQEATSRRLLTWRRVSHTFHRRREESPTVSLHYAFPVDQGGLENQDREAESTNQPPADHPTPPPNPPTPTATLFRIRRECQGWHTAQLPPTSHLVFQELEIAGFASPPVASTEKFLTDLLDQETDSETNSIISHSSPKFPHAPPNNPPPHNISLSPTHVPPSSPFVAPASPPPNHERKGSEPAPKTPKRDQQEALPGTPLTQETDASSRTPALRLRATSFLDKYAISDSDSEGASPTFGLAPVASEQSQSPLSRAGAFLKGYTLSDTDSD